LPLLVIDEVGYIPFEGPPAPERSIWAAGDGREARGRAVVGDDLGQGRTEGYVRTPTLLRDR
jgi:hypothetical protein